LPGSVARQRVAGGGLVVGIVGAALGDGSAGRVIRIAAAVAAAARVSRMVFASRVGCAAAAECPGAAGCAGVEGVEIIRMRIAVLRKRAAHRACAGGVSVGAAAVVRPIGKAIAAAAARAAGGLPVAVAADRVPGG